MRRNRSTPHTFEANITAEKAKLEAQIAKLEAQLTELRSSPQMDALAKEIRQLDTAAHMSEWLSSPGLQPPQPAAQTEIPQRGG